MYVCMLYVIMLKDCVKLWDAINFNIGCLQRRRCCAPARAARLRCGAGENLGEATVDGVDLAWYGSFEAVCGRVSGLK